MFRQSLTMAIAFFLCGFAAASEKHPRPRTLGVFSVHLYSTNLPAARSFYAQLLDDPGIACHWCEATPLEPLRMVLPSKQYLNISAAKGVVPRNMLAGIVFATDDLAAMKEYLAEKNVAINKRTDLIGPGHSNYRSLGSNFSVSDTEGNEIGFIQPPKGFYLSPHSDALRIIHVGFIVKDPAAEDRFFQDVLGFHLYWHGGRQQNKDDWVAMQVPDGTDWIEYMLNVAPTANRRTLGVANHIALGVKDIHAAQQRLFTNGLQTVEEPQIGLDGKWQLNVYDPDGTRSEFMEFKPVERACCSEYSGVQPGPQ
jgi:catechol 2,3-dioxygenase-like lactoylglutathione lyase family enzyme